MPNTQIINHFLGKRLHVLAIAELHDALEKIGSEVECKVTQKIIAAIAGVSQKIVSQLQPRSL